MKKNITINLNGKLYHIDEDAYELLKQYTGALRSYFCRQEGGEEIANDIEIRVGEHFDELVDAGKCAITIEDVQSIIQRVGNLQDITEEEPTGISSGHMGVEAAREKFTEYSNKAVNCVEEWFRKLQTKSYYRDTQNAMAAGVLAGCANYFGGSRFVWRLIFVVLCFCPALFVFEFFIALNVPLIVLYILVAVLAPAASTPQDRLKMKGVDVNPRSIADELTGTVRTSESGATRGENVADTLAKIVTTGFNFMVLLFGIGASVVFIMLFCLFMGLLFTPELLLDTILPCDDPGIVHYLMNSVAVKVFGLGALLTNFIVAYCTLHFSLSGLGTTGGMGLVQRIVWLVLLLVSVAVMVVSGVRIGSAFTQYNHDLWENEMLAYREAHTYNGIYFDDDDREFFDKNGWRLVKVDNCRDYRYTRKGDYYNRNGRKRYLSAHATDEALVYHAEKCDTVAAGLYRLTAVVRCATDGDGAYIYVTDRDSALVQPALRLAMIPAYGDDPEIPAAGDSIRLGGGWSVVTIDSIRVDSRRPICYGVSTDPEFTGDDFDASWFSAADIRLSPM